MQKAKVYGPSENLPERIKRARDYYFLDDKRPHQNVCVAFTTGMPTDFIEHFLVLHAAYSPEFAGMFGGVEGFEQMEEGLRLMAKKLDLPKDFWAQSLIVRRAMVFRQTLRQIDVEILPDELIAGFKFSTGMSSGFNEQEAEEFKKKRRELEDKGVHYALLGVSGSSSAQGHLVADHQTVLEKGFKRVKEEAEENLKKAVSPKRQDFYRSVIICCEAAKEFAHRYALEARKAAGMEKDKKRKAELLQIAENCENMPWNPPRGYWEALQSLWFQHMLIMIAENYMGPGTSFGRLDQYMYPYYKKDLEEKKITRDWAKELFQSFCVKANYAYDYMPALGRHGRHAGDGQLFTVGGMGIGDKDVTNDLTYLCIEAFYELNMLEPKLNVRIHSGTPEKLLYMVSDISAKTQGAPFILNFDKSVIEALENEGLTHEEAVDYAPIGCLENTIRGSKGGTVDVHFNLAKAIELTFNRGRDFFTGEMVTFDTGDPTQFKAFDVFLNAYKAQLKATLDIIIQQEKDLAVIRGEYFPCPYLSTLITGCMEDGVDVNQGGGRYNPTTINGTGIATVVDSLAAVKKFVFDTPKVTMEVLTQALKANFEGYEELRALLWSKAPKFGNDDDYVDLLGRDVSRFWTLYVAKHTTPNGRKFRAGYLSWNHFIPYGKTTMATPDGRRNGTHLSGGVGPVEGQDKNGPTAGKSVV